MIYHLRYWKEVIWRWLRWPFCKWVRQGYCQFEEVLAKNMCDPEFRREFLATKESGGILNKRKAC